MARQTAIPLRGNGTLAGNGLTTACAAGCAAVVGDRSTVRGRSVGKERDAAARGIEEKRVAAFLVVYPIVVGKDRGAPSRRIVSEIYLSEWPTRSRKVLYESRIVDDSRAANRERESRKSRIYRDGVGIRGNRGEDDAIDFRVRRNRDIGSIEKVKGSDVRWPIGNPHWRPVGSRIPVARDGIEIPSGTDRAGSGWKNEYQKAANRCQDKRFHK